MREYFKDSEFKCPCCIDETGVQIAQYVRSACNDIRSYLNKPLYISSGIRCIKRNTVIGGSKTSQHLTGNAVDISTENLDSRDLYKLVEKAMELNLRIGVYQRHVHIDWAVNRAKIFWLGKY